MLFIFNANGDVLDYVPENIYQGSNNANTIYVVAPLSSANQVLAHVTLPNGKIVSPIYATNQDNLTLLDTVVLDDTTYSIWGCKISKVVTAIAGVVSISFEFINETQEISTAATNFPILEGNPPAQPFDLTTETTLQDILAYISQFITNQDSKFASLKADIEQDFSNLETEVQNNFNELSEEILARQEILEENISQEVKKNSSDIRSIYNILEIKDILAYETIPMTTNARVTANGENIVYGAEVELKTVKGNTVKCNNLINVDEILNDRLIKNADGSYTITSNGTDFSSRTFNCYLPSGTYTFSASSCSGSSVLSIKVFTESGESEFAQITSSSLKSSIATTSPIIGIVLTVNSASGESATFTNLMFNIGGTSLPYEPYFVGLKSASFKGIKSTSSNLIPFPYIQGEVSAEELIIKPLDNGGVSLNGTVPNRYVRFQLANSINFLDGITYNLRLINRVSGVYIAIQYYANESDKQSNTTTSQYSGSFVWRKEYTLISLYIEFEPNTEIGNIVVYPMLNMGDTGLPFELYAESIIELPEVVETGLGVTVDFENKVITEKWATITATGNETRIKETQTANGKIYTISFSSSNPARIITGGNLIQDVCTHFNFVSPNTLGNSIPLGGARWQGYGLEFDFCTNFDTFDEFMAYIKSLYDSGNPLKVRYITRDIQNEIPFNEQQSLVNNYYSGYDKGMETIIGNSNSESVNNTIELEYLTITE